MNSHSIRDNWLLYISMFLAFCSLACFILAGNVGAIIVWLCIAGVLLLLLLPHIPRRQAPPTMRQHRQRHRTYRAYRTIIE